MVDMAEVTEVKDTVTGWVTKVTAVAMVAKEEWEVEEVARVKEMLSTSLLVSVKPSSMFHVT